MAKNLNLSQKFDLSILENAGPAPLTFVLVVDVPDLGPLVVLHDVNQRPGIQRPHVQLVACALACHLLGGARGDEGHVECAGEGS